MRIRKKKERHPTVSLSSQTPLGARVALQRCPILPTDKSTIKVSCISSAVNVQSLRRNCPFPAPILSILNDSNCLSPPTYALPVSAPALCTTINKNWVYTILFLKTWTLPVTSDPVIDHFGHFEMNAINGIN